MLIYDVTREDWGAEDPDPGLIAVQSLADYKGVEIHHNASGSMDGFKVYPAIQRAHKRSKGRPDIWYHTGVTPDGMLWELRGWEWRNVGRTMWNVRRHRYLTFNFPGNMEVDYPTMAQWVTLRRVREAIRDAGGGTEVKMHRDRAATLCPGKHVVEVVRSGLLPLRPRVVLEPLDEIPVPGRWAGEGRWPMWAPYSDGRVVPLNGAPELETLQEQGVDRLEAPIVWAFFDDDLARLVLVAEDGGTFALGVKGL